MYRIELYQADKQTQIYDFFEKCLPESNRKFNLQEQHKIYTDIETNFEKFWCMFDEDILIGTAALRNIGNSDCELKGLYLYKSYHGNKLGYNLINTVIDYARKNHYHRMFLDTISTSENALRLYEKIGFYYTERYNNNLNADIFMALQL